MISQMAGISSLTLPSPNSERGNRPEMQKEKKTKKFPAGFLWGSAVSAHQVEGNNTNSDWWTFEHSEKRVRDLRARGKNPADYQSGMACDFYNRYEQDFDLLKKLNQNVFRLSIEWARIEPIQGRFDEKEIIHYKKIVQALRKRNIEPFVTLQHFTLPKWLADQGGILYDRCPALFEKYVEKVLPVFSGLVKYWITVNEPLVLSSSSYFVGVFPPNKKSLSKTLTAINNMAKMHVRAYDVIKKIDGKAQVGLAKNNIYFSPHRDNFFNRILVKAAKWWWNERFFGLIQNKQDFIGLNYYFRQEIGFQGSYLGIGSRSDRGWELYPEGIYYLLKNLKKYNKPIIITENGLADKDDKKRSKYIQEILLNIHRAIEEGVDVRGYLHWSFMDNFEWEDGFKWKFGLVEVDFETQERKVRGSAKEYARICKKNEIS